MEVQARERSRSTNPNGIAEVQVMPRIKESPEPSPEGSPESRCLLVSHKQVQGRSKNRVKKQSEIAGRRLGPVQWLQNLE